MTIVLTRNFLNDIIYYCYLFNILVHKKYNYRFSINNIIIVYISLKVQAIALYTLYLYTTILKIIILYRLMKYL